MIPINPAMLACIVDQHINILHAPNSPTSIPPNLIRLLCLLLQNHNRILQLSHPLPNPLPHLLAHLGLNIRRIIRRRSRRHPPIIRLRLLRLVRLGRRSELSGRIQRVGGEELVQSIARRLAVRRRVDGCGVGAVGGDFEFIFCDFVASWFGYFGFSLGWFGGGEGEG